MTDTNSTTLRSTLSAAVKSYVKANGLTNKDAAEKADVAYGRMCNILSGKLEHISADALVNVLGNFGYRLTGINGSENGTEIVISLDSAEKVLPEIEKPFEYSDGYAVLKDDGIHVNGVHVLGDIKPDAAADFDPDFDRVVQDDE